MTRKLLLFPIIYCLHFTPKAIPSFYVHLEASRLSQPGAWATIWEWEGGGWEKKTNQNRNPPTPNSSSLPSILHFKKKGILAI